MSATIAAALKKIAVYILTDKKAVRPLIGIICFEFVFLTPRGKSACSGPPQSLYDFVGRGRAAK